MGKGMNRNFSKDATQMANRHMKRCPKSPAVREMQIKATVSFHLTPLKWLSPNIQKTKPAEKDVGKKVP